MRQCQFLQHAQQHQQQLLHVLCHQLPRSVLGSFSAFSAAVIAATVEVFLSLASHLGLQLDVKAQWLVCNYRFDVHDRAIA